MIINCPHCGKNLNDLKPTQKGNHIANCKLNPNFEEYQKKRLETKIKNIRKKNPLLKLRLYCINCNKEYEIEVVESYYKRGNYRKCCCKKCANNYSIKDYDDNELKNDNCKKCGKEISVKKRTKIGISCCDSCKKRYKVKKWLKSKEVKNNEIICKFCGDKVCKKPDICNKFRQKNNIFVQYLGFDKNKFGSNEIYIEFDRVVNNLKEDYFNNELSMTGIGKKYKMNYQTVYMIFKKLKIKPRNNSESIFNAIKNGKINYDNVVSYPYKSGYHITWNNKKVHYRSSYELEYYKKLDEQKIDYEVEKLKLIYFDTQKKKRRIAIPDIYIPNENKIIEIKSSWTYDEQNWKDRLKVYEKLGYKVELFMK